MKTQEHSDLHYNKRISILILNQIIVRIVQVIFYYL